MFKLNNSNEYEHLCNVTLTKEKFPKAFAAKVDELIEEGVCTTKEEAEAVIADMVIELKSLFLIWSSSLKSITKRDMVSLQ